LDKAARQRRIVSDQRVAEARPVFGGPAEPPEKTSRISHSKFPEVPAPVLHLASTPFSPNAYQTQNAMPFLADSRQVRDEITHYLHSRYGEHGRRLRIDVQDGRVVLRGRANTYYQKQLWLHGALQVAGAGGVVDEIEVGSA
jgi:hypothetical protein